MPGKITFQTNIPVTLSLLSLDAETAPSQFGGDQLKFTTREGPFWVSEAVGSILLDQIRKKRIVTTSPVEICRREIAQSNGRKGIHWLIDQLGFIPGEQPDGTFAIPAPSPQPPVPKQNGANGVHPPAPLAATPQKQPSIVPDHSSANGNGHANGTNGNGHAPEPNPLTYSGWAGSVRDQAQALIDVYATCLKYASERHAGMVKGEDVRAIVLSAYINVSKGGAR
jgi:hypothetical protein